MTYRTDTTNKNEHNSCRNPKPKAKWTSVHTSRPAYMGTSEDFNSNRFVLQITARIVEVNHSVDVCTGAR